MDDRGVFWASTRVIVFFVLRVDPANFDLARFSFRVHSHSFTYFSVAFLFALMFSISILIFFYFLFLIFLFLISYMFHFGVMSCCVHCPSSVIPIVLWIL
jgi:hypothetical protein